MTSRERGLTTGGSLYQPGVGTGKDAVGGGEAGL